MPEHRLTDDADIHPPEEFAGERQPPRIADSDEGDREEFPDLEGEIIGQATPYGEDEDEIELSTPSKPKNEYRCSFSGHRSKIIHVDQEGDDEGESEEEETAGSGADENSVSEDLDVNPGNATNASVRLALLAGSSTKGEDQAAGITTVVLPFLVPEGATMSNLMHVTVTSEGTQVDWDSRVGASAEFGGLNVPSCAQHASDTVPPASCSMGVEHW